MQYTFQCIDIGANFHVYMYAFTGATGCVDENENKLDEMVDILSTLQEYVPTQKMSANLKVPRPGTDETDKVSVERMHKLLFGGDQLTVARVREHREFGRTHSMLQDVWRVLFP